MFTFFLFADYVAYINMFHVNKFSLPCFFENMLKFLNVIKYFGGKLFYGHGS